jgi:hypothetical protein
MWGCWPAGRKTAPDGGKRWTIDMTEIARRGVSAEDSGSRKPLTPAAERALAEAEARRRIREAEHEAAQPPAREINGRGGLDPVRYGDWEIKGLISDF